MTSRSDSWSRRPLSAVESAISQNRTVTVLRSSRGTTGAMTDPQYGQKRALPGTTEWQLGQVMTAPQARWPREAALMRRRCQPAEQAGGADRRERRVARDRRGHRGA